MLVEETAINISFVCAQDKSHYVNVDVFGSSVEHTRSLDELKQQLATEKGITLIPIPFWWDGTKSRYIHSPSHPFSPKSLLFLSY